MTKRRKERQMLKVLGLVHDHPGSNGVALVNMYRPAAGLLHVLERDGLIVWKDGWYSRGEVPR